MYPQTSLLVENSLDFSAGILHYPGSGTNSTQADLVYDLFKSYLSH